MEKYLIAFEEGFMETLNWTLESITFEVPWYTNYFWGLVAISLLVWLMEILFPWRKNQSIIRRDFWLDGFYMFFNFFIFSIIISGIYKILEIIFGEIGVSAQSIALFDISDMPMWGQLIIFFVIIDFVQWLTHVLLHRYEFYGDFIKYIIQ